MKLVIIALLLTIITCRAQYSYPGTPPIGECYDAVQQMVYNYPGQQVQYALSNDHMWLLVDGTPIDPFEGIEPRTLQWISPQHTFNSFQDVSNYLGTYRNLNPDAMPRSEYDMMNGIWPKR